MQKNVKILNKVKTNFSNMNKILQEQVNHLQKCQNKVLLIIPIHLIMMNNSQEVRMKLTMSKIPTVEEKGKFVKNAILSTLMMKVM